MRLRITFSKTGALRYTGHLDLQTTWERTIRRAGLPLAYTHGFHPGPKIQIASALPLGFIGIAELVDIWLDENVGGDRSLPQSGGVDLGMDTCHFVVQAGRPYADILQSAAPPGLTILSVEEVNDDGPALQTQVVSAEYEVALLDPLDGTEVAQSIAIVLRAESLPRERRGKAYDLRPLIEELSLTPGSFPTGGGVGVRAFAPGLGIFMRLAAREGATGRPEQVLDVLGIPPETTRIQRTRLILRSTA